MKRIFFVMLALIIMSSSHAQVIQSQPFVVADNVMVSRVLTPGTNFYLTIKVTNKWTWDLTNMSVYLTGYQPLLGVSPAGSFSIDELAPGSSSEVVFPLSVDPSAVAGTYSVILNFDFTTYDPTIKAIRPLSNSQSVSLSVEGGPNIDFEIISLNPGELRRSAGGVVSLSVWNNGTDYAKNLRINSESTECVRVLQGSDSRFIGVLQANALTASSINVIVNDSVSESSCVLPVSVYFEDKEGRAFQVSKELSVVLEEEADFEVVNVSQDLLIGGLKDGLVKVAIRNEGNDLAEDLRLSMITTYPFTPSGRNYFIEELSPDGVSEAFFRVNVDDFTATQFYPVDIVIQWTEDGVSKSETLRTGLQAVRKDDTIIYILIGVLFGIIVIAAFLKRLIAKVQKKKKS